MSDFMNEINRVEAMMAVVPDQRSKAWRDVRVEKFTSSEIHRLLTPVYEETVRDMTPEELDARPKTGEGSRTKTVKVKTDIVHRLSKGAITYVQEKVAEHFTGVSKVTEARATLWGEEMEPLAKEHYKVKFGRPILNASFVPLSTVAGGSPDGYTTDRELIERDAGRLWFPPEFGCEFNADTAEIVTEIKCPYESTNMIKYWQMTVDTFREEHFDYYCQIQMNMLVTKKKKGRMIFFDPRQPDFMQMCILDIEPDLVLQDYIVKKIDAAEKMKRAIINEIKFKAELQYSLKAA